MDFPWFPIGFPWVSHHFWPTADVGARWMTGHGHLDQLPGPGKVHRPWDEFESAGMEDGDEKGGLSKLSVT